MPVTNYTNNRKPITIKLATHCQLSYFGLWAVFVAGQAFYATVTATNVTGLVISAVCLLINILCFSFDIQTGRAGNYTRNALGFWVPNKEQPNDVKS